MLTDIPIDPQIDDRIQAVIDIVAVTSEIVPPDLLPVDAVLPTLDWEFERIWIALKSVPIRLPIPRERLPVTLVARLGSQETNAVTVENGEKIGPVENVGGEGHHAAVACASSRRREGETTEEKRARKAQLKVEKRVRKFYLWF